MNRQAIRLMLAAAAVGTTLALFPSAASADPTPPPSSGVTAPDAPTARTTKQSGTRTPAPTATPTAKTTKESTQSQAPTPSATTTKESTRSASVSPSVRVSAIHPVLAEPSGRIAK